jgi:hypothetical protein
MSSATVDEISSTLPQLHTALIVEYSGWISAFIALFFYCRKTAGAQSNRRQMDDKPRALELQIKVRELASTAGTAVPFSE